MIHLMNSAMMPSDGHYFLYQISPRQFATAVANAHHEGHLKSYIGYEQTASMISDLSGVPVEVNREQTVLETGDEMLIARLRYRVANPGTKGQPVPEDFEFFRCLYRQPY